MTENSVLELSNPHDRINLVANSPSSQNKPIKNLEPV